MSLRYFQLLLMRERVKDLLGEYTRTTSGAFANIESRYWTDAEIYRYCNDAYIEAAKESKALEIIEAVTTTSGTGTYTLSSNVGQPFRVVYDDRKLYPTTKWELDRTEPDWENQTGYVDQYILTQMNNRRLRLYKIPEASAGLTVAGAGEYGVIIDIDDGGTNTYTFSSEYGEIADTDGTEWTNNFTSEYGVAIVTGGTAANLFVWATKNPDPMDTTAPISAIPELPYWTHIGIAYRAAAKALRKHGEMRNEKLADAYDMMAGEYLSLLKAFVGNRSGERTVVMGRAQSRRRRPMPWETPVEDS